MNRFSLNRCNPKYEQYWNLTWDEKVINIIQAQNWITNLAFKNK